MKKVVKQTISEQTADGNLKKAVQCFLGKVFKTEIQVDGMFGPETQNMVKKYQKAKGVYPLDGVWGPETSSKMNNKEKIAFKQCIADHGDFMDKILNYLNLN